MREFPRERQQPVWRPWGRNEVSVFGKEKWRKRRKANGLVWSKVTRKRAIEKKSQIIHVKYWVLQCLTHTKSSIKVTTEKVKAYNNIFCWKVLVSIGILRTNIHWQHWSKGTLSYLSFNVFYIFFNSSCTSRRNLFPLSAELPLNKSSS